MTTIIALDTSTETCSVALCVNGQVFADARVIPRQHADQLLGMLSDLMLSANVSFKDLDAITVGCGPGSFTGLRIAIAVAQGLAYAHDLPVVPVSTLKALTWQAYIRENTKQVVSCMDARIGEIYWAVHAITDDVITEVTPEKLTQPGEMQWPEQCAEYQWYGAGNGWLFHDEIPDYICSHIAGYDEKMMPLAEDILTLGLQAFEEQKYCQAHELAPTYLRDKVANKPGTAK